jgi:hypothetical protein
MIFAFAGDSHADDAWRSDPAVVDVSHGIGIPFGGIGTGFCVFGKFGFVMDNPDAQCIATYDAKATKDTTTIRANPNRVLQTGTWIT